MTDTLVFLIISHLGIFIFSSLPVSDSFIVSLLFTVRLAARRSGLCKSVLLGDMETYLSLLIILGNPLYTFHHLYAAATGVVGYSF